MLFTWTGNPWVDGGLATLCILSQKDKPEEILLQDCEQAVTFLKQLYPKWASKGSGFAKIFHNFAPFNFSFKQDESLKTVLENLKNEFEKKRTEEIDEKKKKELEKEFKANKKRLKATPQLKIFTDRYSEFIDDLVKKLKSVGSGHTCIATGQHNAEILLQRDKYPLLGSGDMINYFSFFEEGLGFSYNAAFAMQFAPIAVIEVSEEIKEQKNVKRKGKTETPSVTKKQTKLFLIHSHDERIYLNDTVGILPNAVRHFQKMLSQDTEIGFYSPPIKTRNLIK